MCSPSVWVGAGGAGPQGTAVRKGPWDSSQWVRPFLLEVAPPECGWGQPPRSACEQRPQRVGRAGGQWAMMSILPARYCHGRKQANHRVQS